MKIRENKSKGGNLDGDGGHFSRTGLHKFSTAAMHACMDTQKQRFPIKHASIARWHEDVVPRTHSTSPGALDSQLNLRPRPQPQPHRTIYTPGTPMDRVQKLTKRHSSSGERGGGDTLTHVAPQIKGRLSELGQCVALDQVS